MRVGFTPPWAALALLCCSQAACTPTTPQAASLEVYLRTDLSPAELEGAEVRVDVRAAEPVDLPASELAQARLASPGGSLVAVFLDLEAGRYDVMLSLRGAALPAGAGATAVVDFAGEGAQQVVVLVLRDADASCTTASDCDDAPCATEACVEGGCFVTRTEDWTAECACDTDAACAGAGACGVGRCEAHLCTVVGMDEACGTTGVCRPDLSCDAVSCRGRGAGDECRPATGPCDRGERCVAGERECPPDRVRTIGEGCRDTTGETGFCVGDAGGSLTCQTTCTAGSACQDGCLVGRTVCVPTPMCDTSEGAVAADGMVCTPASTCVAPGVCQAGACVPGAITDGAFCGEDPFAECADRPVCNVAGACEIQVRPVGSPCGSDPSLCTELRCAADGVCSPVNLPTDPRCPPTRVGECGVMRCGFGASMDWTCRAVADSTFDCGPVPLCAYQRFCHPNRHVCANQPAFDGEQCYCGSNPNPFTCYDQICEGCNSCENGEVDPPETDVDCGGDVGCRLCYEFQRCTNNYDCESNACARGRCLPYDCLDGTTSGEETDVDCGGSVCAPCAPGQACSVASDCDSLNCDANVCTCPGPGPGCA